MSDDRPTFGSLFAGIGGIDLGLERAGWRGRWQVEWDPFCQRVLAKHWPDVQRYGDITTVDWSGVERVDLLAGGFPCQPVSGAGKRKAQSGGSGRSSSEPFALYDLGSSLWRTSQTSLQSTMDQPSERWLGTWPRAGMTRSGIAFQQRPSVPHMTAIESGSWPTPSANQYETEPEIWQARRERERVRHRNGNGFGLTLSMAVQQWRTPTARDYRSGSGVDYKLARGSAVGLNDQVMERWPTPMSADSERTSEMMVRGNPTLLGAARRWPTPSISMVKGSSAGAMVRISGKSRHNDRLDYAVERGDTASGRLNPDWIEPLMGFPMGWTNIGGPLRPARSTAGSHRASSSVGSSTAARESSPSETRSSRRSSK